MAHYKLNFKADAQGLHFILASKARLPFSKEKQMPVDEWPAHASHHPGVSLLLTLENQGEAQSSSQGIGLTHERLASLTSVELSVLELPAKSPFSLSLSRRAPLNDPAFNIQVDWIDRDGRSLFSPARTGSLLRAEGKDWLVMEPIFSLLKSIDVLNSLQGNEDLDPRMVAYANFREHLAKVTGDVHADEYLKNLFIHHATGFGIDLEPGPDQPLAPVLYGDTAINASQLENEEVEPEREPLLPQFHAEKFQNRFEQQGGRRHYTLGNGVYTVLDAPVTAALEVVEEVNRGGEAARAAFRNDPMAFLLPAIEAVGGSGDVICDLKGYGERVIGVGPWEQARLSFRLPVTKEWFPESAEELFTLLLPDGKPLLLKPAEVGALQQAISEAREAGQTSIQFGGESLTLDERLEETVRGLIGYVTPETSEEEKAPPSDEEKKPSTRPITAIVKENLESLGYRAALRNPEGRLKPGLPAGLKSGPKPHQHDGIQWLQAGYLAGAPGLLLADDMGLGKTFQVLAFLHWLRSSTKGLRPFLIVAPKTLLGNWLEEVQIHLGSNALGRELRVYEKGLRELKIKGVTGNDTSQGRQTLDVTSIEAADWVLTTYETLRDYHLSFGKVRFSVAIYDEAQKLKNPTSLMTLGAKAQQPDFTLLMTGTPIENSVADLWSLLDIVWPGFTGKSLKDFLNRYANAEAAPRDELKRSLTEAQPPMPAVMLRRFKVDLLDGLPPRTLNQIREPMPPAQKLAYDMAIQKVRHEGLPAIAGLQAFRVISLHPDLSKVPREPAQHNTFIEVSARFRILFRILDEIHAKGEKALVFVELRDAQSALYELIQHRYSLPAPRPERITGETQAPARDRIRKDFQARSGFDVLLLGPKAAGFGLTLTAANHVIHLNRWWNPAVEDQCSDRVYRIGAKLPVTIHIPIAIHPELGDKSFDCLLDELLEEKRALSREIVVPAQFNPDDFKRLFDGAMGGQADRSQGQLVNIDNMDWQHFEDWVAAELSQAGFQVQKTPRGADGGADIIARSQSSRIIVQCKHRSQGERGDKVNESVIDELLKARIRYGTNGQNRLVAVTNGHFTLSAQRAAEEHQVALYGRDELFDLARLRD